MSIRTFLSKNLSRLMVSAGGGGILSVGFTELCRSKLLPFLEKQGGIEFLVANLHFTNTQFLQSIILFISILLIVCAPLFVGKNLKKSYQIFFLLVLAICTILSVCSVMAQLRINITFIVFTTIFSSYLVWTLFDVLNIIWLWMAASKITPNSAPKSEPAKNKNDITL